MSYVGGFSHEVEGKDKREEEERLMDWPCVVSSQRSSWLSSVLKADIKIHEDPTPLPHTRHFTPSHRFCFLASCNLSAIWGGLHPVSLRVKPEISLLRVVRHTGINWSYHACFFPAQLKQQHDKERVIEPYFLCSKTTLKMRTQSMVTFPLVNLF